MECCGQEQLTKFCPHCGRSLTFEPINQLLAHITSQASKYSRIVEKNERGDYQNHCDIRARNKWQSWEKALRELIEKTGQGVPDSNH